MAVIDELKILVTAEVAQAVANLNKVQQSTNQAGGGFKDFAKQVAGYTTAAGLAVSATKAVISGTANLVKESISLAAGFETARISWGVMLGDMGKGEKMFTDIQKLAASTPLSFQGVEQGARTLKQFGLATEDVIPTIKMLGDVSGGNEERLSRLSVTYGQVMSAGRLLGQDLLQLISVGFNPLQVISQKTGETMAQLKKRMESGGISSQEVAAAFKAATSEGGLFYGMMDKTAKTTAGLWSTAQDNFRQGLAELGEKIIPIVNKALEEYNKQVDIAKGKKAIQGGTASIEQYQVLIDDLTKSISENIKTINMWKKQLENPAYSEMTGAINQNIESLVRQNESLLKNRGELMDNRDALKASKDRTDQATESTKKATDADTKRIEKLEYLAELADPSFYSAQTMGAIEYAASLKTVSDAMTWYADSTEGAIEHTAILNTEAQKTAEQMLYQIRLDEFKKGRGLLGGESSPVAHPKKETISAWDAYIKKLKESRDETNLLVEAVGILQSAWGDAFESVGEALVTGEDGLKSFAKASLKAVGAILEALGKELAVRAIAALVPGTTFNPAAAAGYGVASAGAFVAAGAVKAIPMADGGIVKARPGGTLARIGEAGRDEAVIPLNKPGSRLGTTINVYGTLVHERELEQYIKAAAYA